MRVYKCEDELCNFLAPIKKGRPKKICPVCGKRIIRANTDVKIVSTAPEEDGFKPVQ